jgi:hypothetical protein
MRKSRKAAGLSALAAVGSMYFGAHAASDIVHESVQMGANLGKEAGHAAAKKLGGLANKAIGRDAAPSDTPPEKHESLPVRFVKLAVLQEHIAPKIVPEHISNEVVLTGDLGAVSFAACAAAIVLYRRETKADRNFHERFAVYTPELEAMEAEDAARAQYDNQPNYDPRY